MVSGKTMWISAKVLNVSHSYAGSLRWTHNRPHYWILLYNFYSKMSLPKFKLLRRYQGSFLSHFFAAAFKGRHKNIVSAMVNVWPFKCLHIGALITQESQHELLLTMIESFQFLPVHNMTSR